MMSIVIYAGVLLQNQAMCAIRMVFFCSVLELVKRYECQSCFQNIFVLVAGREVYLVSAVD